MGFEVRVESDNTQKVIDEVHDRALVALDAVGLQAATLSKMELQKSPERIDTGLLRNSITHAVSGQPAAVGAYTADSPKKGRESGSYGGTAPEAESPDKPFVLVGTNVEYAIYVHEGTQSMTPNRFIANAMRSNSGEFQKIIEKVMSS